MRKKQRNAVCLSMLILPIIVYSVFTGYGGYDCSARTCPFGRDPTLTGSAATDGEEEV